MEEYLRKKLLYRSLHRGCKETDLILGKFAETHINNMNSKELQEFEIILNQMDSDIVSWVMRRASPPFELHGPVMRKLLS
jgi:antitoxin CptB